MSENFPKNSGPEGRKPLSFSEYLGAINRPLVSAANAERIGLITETLLAGGLTYAFLGMFMTENIRGVVEWAVLAPAVLWFIGAFARKSVNMHPIAISTGAALGVTAAMAEGLLSPGKLEADDLLARVVFGIAGFMGAAAAVAGGVQLVDKLIHPQVGPRE